MYRCHYRTDVRIQGTHQGQELQQGVAIKIPKDVTRFRRKGRNAFDDLEKQDTELRTLIHLRGVSGVLQLQEYFFDKQKLVLVTELLGRDLGEYMGDANPCTDDILRETAKALLSAIKHMHEASVVHCDLKPQNIMVPVSRTGFGLRVKASSFSC